MSKQKFPTIIKFCELCNEEIPKNKRETWETYHNKKFCSVECYKNSRSKSIKKICIICDKEFIVHNFRKNDAKFCSYGCYWYNKKGQESKKKNGIIKKCSYCDKEIYVVPNRLKDNNFCSIKCFNIFQTGEKVKLICKICNGEYELIPSKAKLINDKYHYCSWDCYIKDTDKLIMNGINSMKIQTNKKGPNNLELKGRKLLNELNLKFNEQVQIKFSLVDIFISKYNLIIMWDGDYWHGNPEVFNKLTNRQLNRKYKDKSVNKMLLGEGFNLLRFWENDVNNNYNKVKNEIQSYCK